MVSALRLPAASPLTWPGSRTELPFVILLMVVGALYAFYASLGGRPIFGGAALEE